MHTHTSCSHLCSHLLFTLVYAHLLFTPASAKLLRNADCGIPAVESLFWEARPLRISEQQELRLLEAVPVLDPVLLRLFTGNSAGNFYDGLDSSPISQTLYELESWVGSGQYPSDLWPRGFEAHPCHSSLQCHLCFLLRLLFLLLKFGEPVLSSRK